MLDRANEHQANDKGAVVKTEFINGIMEDICREIGFEASVRLAAVHGGRTLYVPMQCAITHPLHALLGEKPYLAFVDLYGGETLTVPKLEAFDRWRRVRGVSDLLKRGIPRRDVAKILGLTERQIINLAAMAEEIGLLPLVLGEHLPAIPCESELIA